MLIARLFIGCQYEGADKMGKGKLHSAHVGESSIIGRCYHGRGYDANLGAITVYFADSVIVYAVYIRVDDDGACVIGALHKICGGRKH